MCIWHDYSDNGTGGTFALYSLLCRHAKVRTIPNQHRTDEELTTYSRSTFPEKSFAAKTKRWLEKHASRKNGLLMLVLVGTCMVIGDGILTPAISGIDLAPRIFSLMLIQNTTYKHYENVSVEPGLTSSAYLFIIPTLLSFNI